MRIELLEYCLDILSSLEHFYLSEYDAIKDKAEKGMAVNQFGYEIYYYYAILLSGTEQERKSSRFLKIKERLERYVEFGDTASAGEAFKFRYRYKETAVDELIKQGIELNANVAAKAFRKFADMSIIHGNNTLIMLLIRFEEFFSMLLSELFVLFPQKYLDAQMINYSEIVNCGVEEIKNKIVQREIDAMMRKSYADWFKILKSHGINFDTTKAEYKAMQEIYARRNILVHNSGKVNSAYLAAVPDTKARIGDILYATEEYLKSAFQVIRSIVFSIMIESTKLAKCDKNEYLYAIFMFAFELLKADEYEICEDVYRSIYCNKFAAEDTRKLSFVNYMICKKRLNGLDSIKDEIEGFDVSALVPSFSIAKDLLLEKYDKATSEISQLYERGELSPATIEEWPIFAEYRKTKQYKDFKMEHFDDFNVPEQEVEQRKKEEVESQESVVCEETKEMVLA